MELEKDSAIKLSISLWRSQLSKISPYVEAPPYRGNISRFIQQAVDDLLDKLDNSQGMQEPELERAAS